MFPCLAIASVLILKMQQYLVIRNPLLHYIILHHFSNILSFLDQVVVQVLVNPQIIFLINFVFALGLIAIFTNVILCEDFWPLLHMPISVIMIFRKDLRKYKGMLSHKVVAGFFTQLYMRIFKINGKNRGEGGFSGGHMPELMRRGNDGKLYDAYARRVGHSTRVSQYCRSNYDGTVSAREFLCSREGLK